MFKLIQHINLFLEILVLKVKLNLVGGKVIHGFTEVSLFLQRIEIMCKNTDTAATGKTFFKDCRGWFWIVQSCKCQTVPAILPVGKASKTCVLV